MSTTIPSVGRSSVISLPETPAAETPKTNVVTPESTNLPAVQQDPKEKVGGLKLDGQIKEAQVRSQFGSNGPQFKMPGVDVKGPGLDDKHIAEGFKSFDKPMPSVDMKWPDRGDFKETIDKDGSKRRELVDADGNKFNERIDKNGVREREKTDKDGNRTYEISDPKGYVMRGAADTKGNSWTVDNTGVTTRMHQDAAGRLFMESRVNGTRQREMKDRAGNFYTEKMEQNGKIERESGDGKGNKQFELKDSKSWMKGFADNKGNSYSVDSDGSSTKMHQDPDGKTYSEHIYKDGSRFRQIHETNGNAYFENKDANGNITQRFEKVK
jgi:hypothetical protein